MQGTTADSTVRPGRHRAEPGTRSLGDRIRLLIGLHLATRKQVARLLVRI